MRLPLRRGAAAAVLAATLATVPSACADAPDDRRLRTYANPIDLPYRYRTAAVPYREAADPTVVRFAGRYWLFASHSQGYWWSTDLARWTFVRPTGFDVDAYAPTAMSMDGRLYLAVSEGSTKIWSTDDPLAGRWREVADVGPGFYDPCLFLDDDGRVYMYDGLSGIDTLRARELDRKTFAIIAERDVLASRDPAHRGWEVVGDANERTFMPSYIEGSWMTKHAGRYYLQYAAPGTEFKTYADGVLVADAPLGPFRYAPYSPFSAKPTGFIGGAGHGSTFADADGGWWHVATMSISQRFKFERRLGLFPATFAADGTLTADTYLGDYPHYREGDRGLTGWMLLSLRRPVRASSTLGDHAPGLAVDEDVRTWWSSRSGDAGEWYEVDLGAPKRIEAVQINFADQDSHGPEDRDDGISHDGFAYVLELSDDGRSWHTAIDRSHDARDTPHDYEVLAGAQTARYARLRSLHTPDGGKFSLYDLRVFGNGGGDPPAAVDTLQAVRDVDDPRRARLSWPAAQGTQFYIVRLGTSPDAMNQNYQVYGGQRAVAIASLNVGVGYVAAVDAVNENGIARWRGDPVAIAGRGETR